MYRYCPVTKKNHPVTFLEKEYLKSLTIFNLVFKVVLLNRLSKILSFDGKYRTFIWNNRIWYVSFLHGILQSITLYQYAYIHSPFRWGGVGGGAAYLVAGGRGPEATVLLWFARLFTTLISLVVTKCVRPLRGRLLLTPTAAGYVPLALHPRLWTFAAFGDGKREREGDFCFA